MIDEQAKRRPRRWIRRTIIGLMLAATLVWLWFVQIEKSDLQRARGVRLGQTMNEVLAITGTKYMIEYLPPPDTTIVFGRMHYLRFELGWEVKQLTGWSRLMPDDDWPVVIRFGSDGRVYSIRRGSEIVESPKR